MKLITTKIICLAEEQMKRKEMDRVPVAKFFNPVGSATWLMSEYDPETKQAFGLCDLGFGTPELGRFSVAELEQVELPFGCKIERDIYFEADKTLFGYAKEAKEHGQILA